MSYEVRSSEKLRKSGADCETKALLYLMNYRDDSAKMHFFVVDFFNDITGMDNAARKLWDIQSKASKTGSAKTIGRELVTLYKNYVSDLQFVEYIIFLGGVPDTFRKDSTQTVFKINNVNDSSLKSIKAGLVDECNKKKYIPTSEIDDDKIGYFLEVVWFVIDDKKPEEYIRKIIEKHPAIIPSDTDLLSIFNEIRNKQSEKKNTMVEGVIIDNADEVLSYGRHLTTNEIRLLVIQRILNTDPLSDGIPLPFIEIYSKYPKESAKDMLDKCKASLCRALFNKSATQGFWSLFDKIYSLLIEKPEETINYIYNEIDDEIIEQCPDLDALSIKYFIAKTKEGIQK
ncbi:hypothetical protein [Gallibacterium anatis]|uniref:hypothetical protein n=1 Tax=Gallibacterium anatis TaxID=750 RepID=UPI0005312975|nr:hypothetical protein [Gallibacterium anatis]KGQ63008.1 hypothetical protein IO49_11275 [Gallibacterium anatis]